MKGQCIKCHGPTGLGDGGEIRYDVWNKPKGDLIKAGRADEIAQLYALPIQELKARNLRMGVYRGGRRPVDLYRRIYAGIKGAEMPALGATEVKPGLSNEEIWTLVDYVRSLPYEEESREPREQTHTASVQMTKSE